MLKNSYLSLNNEYLDQGFIEVNALNGNASYLFANEKYTKHWLSDSNKSKIRFLKLRVEKDSIQRKILYQSIIASKQPLSSTSFHRLSEEVISKKLDQSTIEKIIKETDKSKIQKFDKYELKYITPSQVKYLRESQIPYITGKDVINEVSRQFSSSSY